MDNLDDIVETLNELSSLDLSNDLDAKKFDDKYGNAHDQEDEKQRGPNMRTGTAAIELKCAVDGETVILMAKFGGDWHTIGTVNVEKSEE